MFLVTLGTAAAPRLLRCRYCGHLKDQANGKTGANAPGSHCELGLSKNDETAKTCPEFCKPQRSADPSKLYSVIYWEADKIHIAQNPDGSVWTASQLAAADEKADEIEAEAGHECRTISLDGVTEG